MARRLKNAIFKDNSFFAGTRAKSFYVDGKMPSVELKFAFLDERPEYPVVRDTLPLFFGQYYNPFPSEF